jgi:hypothetical protein
VFGSFSITFPSISITSAFDILILLVQDLSNVNISGSPSVMAIVFS